jgi:hypothetical protein
MYAVGMAPHPEAVAAVLGHVEIVMDALTEWNAGYRFLNFSERPAGHDAFAPAAYRRLRAVKTLVDPDDMIRSNHPIAPID